MKTLKKIMLPLLLIAMILTGVNLPQAQEGTQTYHLYHLDQTESRLIAETYVPETEEIGRILEDVQRRLNEAAATGGNGVALLPEGIQIENYELDGQNLILYMTEGYSQIGLGREIITREGLVKIFTQFAGIGTIELYNGDQPMTNTRGDEVGRLSEDNFVDLASDEEAYRTDRFTLYFTDISGKKLYAETRTIYYKRNIPKARVALEQLIKGPMEKDHYPTLADSVEVNSITNAGGTYYIDFNKTFVNKSYSLEDDLVIASIVNTLIASTDAEKVQLMIGGEEQVTIGDGTELYNFYTWSDDYTEGE